MAASACSSAAATARSSIRCLAAPDRVPTIIPRKFARWYRSLHPEQRGVASVPPGHDRANRSWSDCGERAQRAPCTLSCSAAYRFVPAFARKSLSTRCHRNGNRAGACRDRRFQFRPPELAPGRRWCRQRSGRCRGLKRGFSTTPPMVEPVLKWFSPALGALRSEVVGCPCCCPHARHLTTHSAIDRCSSMVFGVLRTVSRGLAIASSSRWRAVHRPRGARFPRQRPAKTNPCRSLQASRALAIRRSRTAADSGRAPTQAVLRAGLRERAVQRSVHLHGARVGQLPGATSGAPDESLELQMSGRCGAADSGSWASRELYSDGTLLDSRSRPRSWKTSSSIWLRTFRFRCSASPRATWVPTRS